MMPEAPRLITGWVSGHLSRPHRRSSARDKVVEAGGEYYQAGDISSTDNVPGAGGTEDKYNADIAAASSVSSDGGAACNSLIPITCFGLRTASVGSRKLEGKTLSTMFHADRCHK